MLSLTGCNLMGGGGNGSGEYVDKWVNLVNETRYDAVVNGNTITYGDHTYTIVSDIDVDTKEYKKATASVTFSNIPSGFTEFEAVYNGLLGKSVAGTVAMIPMAMEIYARKASTGEKCFNLLCNSSATVSGIIRELKNKIVASDYSPENDQYIQRFLPAALLKGATNKNAYSPSTPYTVEMTMSPNGVQDAPLTGGEVTYVYILAGTEQNPGGWDTYQRGVEVIQFYNSDTYKVFNCPSCYTQCKPIQGSWGGLK